jgi:hypothetical protein
MDWLDDNEDEPGEEVPLPALPSVDDPLFNRVDKEGEGKK